MNKTQLFYKVKSHLLSQNEACFNDDGRCAYQNEEGLKCAIGAVLPSGMYDPEFENKSLRVLVFHYPEVAQLFEGEGCFDLGTALQRIHDGYTPDEWASALESLRLESGIERA